MLFGQSAFQSVLTRLKEEEKDGEGGEPRPDAFRINGLASGFVAEMPEQTATPGSAAERASAYFETAADAKRTADEPRDTGAWSEPLVFADDGRHDGGDDDADDGEHDASGPNAGQKHDEEHGRTTSAHARYGEDFAAPARKAPAQKQTYAHLLRLSEAEIAEELAISLDDTEATLTEKRRRFARHNHPDGAPPRWRDNATIRMKTANLMIDAAINRLRPR